MVGFGSELGASLRVGLETLPRTTDGAILRPCLGVLVGTGLLLGSDSCVDEEISSLVAALGVSLVAKKGI